MNRIMVIGVSAGVGKSTFARRLGDALNIPVYHLDALFWRPGWVESSLEEFAAAQRDIVAQAKWIVEGNYSNTYDIRAEQADTIIYLELPLRVCLYRVMKRWVTHLGQTRSDMGKDCKEKIDFQFIKFIYTTYYPRKAKSQERLARFAAQGDNKTIVVLKNKKAIQQYLNWVSK